MPQNTPELELLCPQCSAVELCDAKCMLARLRSVGILKREAKPDPELLRELFRGSANKFTCHRCDHLGLVAREASVEEWPETRKCQACGTSIPRERLEIFPQAQRCAACESQSKESHSDEIEYCPRCGEIMTVRLSRGSGISRYMTFCPSCKR